MEIRYLFTAIIFYYWLTCACVYAQENMSDYDHYEVKDGLPTQTTYNLLQDRKGFLWIATDAGVSRFDGKNFVNYTTRDGLGDNEITNLLEDSYGRIWFIPFSSRLSYYFNGEFRNEDNDSMLKALHAPAIFNIVEDNSGNLYMKPKGNTRIISRIGSDNSVVSLNTDAILGSNDEVSVLHSSVNHEHVYGITKNNRWILLSGSVPVEIKFNGISPIDDGPAFWFPDTKSTNLIYTNKKGIHMLSDTISRLLVPADQVPFPNNHCNIMMDKYGHIWVSNFRLNNYYFRYTGNKYLSFVPVMAEIFSIVSFDEEDNIWFCTPNRGLYKISYAKFFDSTTSFLNHSLLHSNVHCIHADAGGTLWLGYGNGNVTQISGRVVKHYNLNFMGRSYNRILQIQSEDDGDIWCATDETCVLLKKKAPDIYVPLRPKVDNKYYYCATKGITFSRAADVYITIPGNQLRINSQSLNADLIHPDTDSSVRNYSSFFDSRDRWYVSTISGLLLLEGNRKRNLAIDDQRLKARIQHFAENTEGIIFLATYSEGLFALKNDRIVAGITNSDGLSGVICRRIYLKNDTLYIVTNGGITVAAFTGNRFKILRNFDISDGLPSLYVNDLTFIGNTLYAATSQGIGVLHLPVEKLQQVKPPAITIMAFMVNEKMYSFDEPIIFSYKERRVTIEYVAPVMDKVSLVKYRYRFPGRDKEWLMTASGQLEFNNLPYGDSRLEIQAKKYNSSWGPSKEVFFTIIPPFYSTWWFRISAILCAGICLYLVAKYRLTKRFRLQLARLKQKEAIEKERNRIAADLHDDIGSELTNIVIQSRILKKSALPVPVAAIADQLEKASNEIINKMNEVIWTLNKANDTLHNLAAYLRRYINRLLDEQGLRGKVIIDDNLFSDHQIKADLSRNILMILKEILHNVVKHSGACQVEIRLNLKSGPVLFLEIRDNGKGFDTGKIYTGNGLQNIRKRTQSMNGTVYIFSQPGAGCFITISLPL